MALHTGAPVRRFRERGLALIRDTHGRDLRSVYSGLGETTGRHIGLTVEQFIGIVLHPARLGIQLGELLLRHLNNTEGSLSVSQIADMLDDNGRKNVIRALNLLEKAGTAGLLRGMRRTPRLRIRPCFLYEECRLRRDSG